MHRRLRSLIGREITIASMEYNLEIFETRPRLACGSALCRKHRLCKADTDPPTLKEEVGRSFPVAHRPCPNKPLLTAIVPMCSPAISGSPIPPIAPYSHESSLMSHESQKYSPIMGLEFLGHEPGRRARPRAGTQPRRIRTAGCGAGGVRSGGRGCGGEGPGHGGRAYTYRPAVCVHMA